ncbi:A/G-specific adenine glycosylase [Bifidobacterium ruminantium]|uniref:A/G-specific adenine glycosylase n=1 Tax=Bifidobacterium ruminantium TaxID=78346 RepID=UPI003D185BA2
MNDTNTTYDTAVCDADFDDFADSATAVTSDASDADEIETALAQWWHDNARDLPWRFGRTTPWGVLVSEVMSQQTQMGRVVPYWTAWMERWPDAAALAEAPKSDVITAWGRLGYPRRALRLRECAHVVACDYADELPRTYDELLALPGIGDYTASAVLSFAFGERIAVIDTNIRRVLSRAFVGVESFGGAASPAERALAKRLLPDDGFAKCRRFDRPSVVWNQSVMELGATVCTAKSPLCDACPIAAQCAFLRNGRPGLGERRTRPRQRFQGTDRQVRGLVLNALRGLPDGETTLDRGSVEKLWKDYVQLDKCIASLDEDGLIEILPGGGVRLPD